MANGDLHRVILGGAELSCVEDAGGNIVLRTAAAAISSVNAGSGYSYKRVTGSAAVKSGPGTLHTLNIAGTGVITAGVMTVYDSLAASGTVIWSGIVPVGSGPLALVFDVPFTIGLFIGYDGSLANVAATVTYI